MPWPFPLGYLQEGGGFATLTPEALEAGTILSEIALAQVSRDINIGPVEAFIVGVETARITRITFLVSEAGVILSEVSLARPSRTVDIGPVEQFIVGTETVIISREILVSESGTILAEITIAKVSRTVNIGPVEQFIVGVETASFNVNFILEEIGALLAEVGLNKPTRNVDLAVEQLISGIETAIRSKMTLTLSEAGVILATTGLAKVSRAKTLAVEQLIVGVEAGTLTINVTLPVISSCSSADVLGLEISWATGILTESVHISVRDNADDSEVTTANVDTAPSTGGYTHTFMFLPAATYYALITPYDGNNQTGTAGNNCQTNTTVIT